MLGIIELSEIVSMMYSCLLIMVVSSIACLYQWIKVTPQCLSAIHPTVPFIIEYIYDEPFFYIAN